MLKTLLRKQLTEFKYSYFTSKKTGKKRSKKAIIGLSILYFYIYILLLFAFFGVTMGIFIFINTKKNAWIMFAIMCFLTVFVSTFINMLITKGILYEAKDNEMLLALPIKDRYILFSRMLHVLLNSLIYTSIIWIPAVISYQINFGFNLSTLLYGIIIYFLLSLVVVILACLFGYLLSLIDKKLHKKNLFQTLITLLFLAIYYVVYFNAKNIMDALLANLPLFTKTIRTKVFILYAISKAATGETLNLLISVLLCLLIFIVGFLIINANYRKLLISTPSTKKKSFNGIYSKQSSIHNTLISRELKLFFSNSTYTINVGLGVVILVIGSIAAIIFKDKISEAIVIINTIPIIKECIPILIFCVPCMIVSMDALATPAVSLEGKSYWIIRSLPVSSYDVLNAKRLLQFRMNVIPAILFTFVCTYIFKIEGISQVLLILITGVTCSFISYFDLFLGIMGINLKWNNEIVPVKQAGNVFVAILGGMILFSGIFLLYAFLLIKYINPDIYLICLMVLFELICIFMNMWLKKGGVRRFEEVG